MRGMECSSAIAGFLRVERCVEAHAEQARKLGAELHEDEEALGWRADERHVEVVTKRDRYAAATLVVTAGMGHAAIGRRGRAIFGDAAGGDVVRDFDARNLSP